MLEHASRMQNESRQVVSSRVMDCFDTVCGQFVETKYQGIGPNGEVWEEIGVAKQEAEGFKVYWFRSDSMLATIAQQQAEEEQSEDPIEIMYDQLTATFPSLYQYPPCRNIRPSSNNLIGETTPLSEIDPEAIEKLAEGCGPSFCFAHLGNKIATLCP